MEVIRLRKLTVNDRIQRESQRESHRQLMALIQDLLFSTQKALYDRRPSSEGYPTLPLCGEKPRIPAQDYVTRYRTDYQPLLNLFQAVHRTNDRAFVSATRDMENLPPYTAHMSGVQVQNVPSALASGMQRDYMPSFTFLPTKSFW